MLNCLQQCPEWRDVPRIVTKSVPLGEGFRYAGALKRKIDCNAVYKLLDEGLWWPLLAGKRLAIVSGHAEALATRLMDAEFVRDMGSGEITWSVATKVACPPVHEPKRSHWSRMRDELLTGQWDLLLCSAGSLSAILCDQARKMARKAIDTGSLDSVILTVPARIGSTTAPPGSRPAA